MISTHDRRKGRFTSSRSLQRIQPKRFANCWWKKSGKQKNIKSLVGLLEYPTYLFSHVLFDLKIRIMWLLYFRFLSTGPRFGCFLNLFEGCIIVAILWTPWNRSAVFQPTRWYWSIIWLMMAGAEFLPLTCSNSHHLILGSEWLFYGNAMESFQYISIGNVRKLLHCTTIGFAKMDGCPFIFTIATRSDLRTTP